MSVVVSPPRAVVRRIAGLASLALVAALVGVGGPVPSAAAAAGITLAKSGPSTVLADAAAAYSLTVANPSSNPTAAAEYNVSFRDVLPVGVAYVPGSTTPASAGEPKIVVDATTGAQTLIWSNVTDLQIGDSFTLGFSADTDATVLPVGATFTNTGSVYSHTDPRRIPSFSVTGLPVAGSFTESATSTPVTTTVSALTITKSEPSPESELLRGVHDQTTVYTLIVRNTAVSSTSSVVVTDYLPATLELLGCGGVDNSAGPEYPGAPLLTATPAVPGCSAPVSVTTVSNPPAQGSTTYPPGVYTRVRWNVGTIAAGGTVTLKYAAGIPLRANTTTFPGGAPSGASLGQVANLDNNTGPRTRETATEAGATNVARAVGTYSGPVVSGGNPVSETDTRHTVTIEDLRMRKSVSPTTFHAGQQVGYTVTIDGSEYTSAGGVRVTDLLPNGLCPTPATGVTYIGTPSSCTGSALPQPQVRVNGGPPVLLTATVAVQTDGTFRLQFSPLPTIPANGTAVLTYGATMEPVYTGGTLDGDPTASGDSFTNTVALSGTTTPIPLTGETGTQTVSDSSSATLGTDALTIDKTIGPRSSFPTAGGPLCGTDGVDYAEPSALPSSDTAFRKGDVVCFKVRVDFPSTSSTRNPVVTDFLPVGTEYVAGSAVATTNNVGASSTLAEAADALTWTIGTPAGSGRYPALGAVFEWVFAVTVTDAAPIGSPDVLGNAMKLRAEDSSGRGRSYRDLVDFTIVPAAPIGVVKGVQSIDAPAAGPNGLNSNVDGLPVREGARVVFRIDLTNLGTPGGPDGYSAGAFDLWDVLPDGITCAQISGITAVASNPATPTIRCTDPGDPLQPSFSLNATRSAIRWTYAADLTKPVAAQVIAPGESFSYTYVMTVPAPTAAGFVFTNNAAVRSFQALTNVPSARPGSLATYFPQNNIDTTVPGPDQQAPPASDTSSVVMPKDLVGKVGTTSITETNNNTPNQATIGELVTYRYAVTLPAGTSVFDASLVDSLPPGVVLQPAPAPTLEFCPVAPTPTGPDPLPVCASPAPVPGNVVLDTATGAVSFTGTLDNTTASPQRFLVTATARVTPTALTTAQNAINRTNTARFTGVDGPGGSAIPAVSASYTVNVRQPNPSILKTNDTPGVVVGGQTVTFTVSVLNQNTPTTTTNRPPLHDSFVVDCIPAGLTFAAYGANAGLAPVAGTGTNGCPVTTTRLVWALGDVGPSTAATTRTYTATVDPSAVGGVTFTNVATLTGSTLDDGKPTFDTPDNPDERVYSVSDTSSVTVAGSGLIKAVDEPIRTIGQTATFTIVTAIPPNTNFYAASIIDRVPAGFSAPANATYSCVDTTTSLPCGTTGTPLTPAPQSDGSTLYGFTVGDLLASPNIRLETITYTATVLDVPSNKAGVARTNTALTAWFITPGHTPTSAGTAFDRTGSSDTATVTVVEPRLSIAKTVSDTTPDPGQPFHYSLVVANASGATVSDAFNTVVTDTVPVGVVVDPASITNGGVLTAADPVTGGGTITWPASELTGPLAPGGTYVLGYSAVLAPSQTLDTSVLRNTARVTRYESLPSGGRVYTGPSTQANVTPQFPNLVTAKTATDGAPTYIGTPYTWTVTSTNTGGAEAFAVEVADTLPASWLYVAGSARVSVNGGPAVADEPTVVSVLGHSVLRWTDTADLLTGQKVTITYRATPQPGVVTTPGVGASVPQTNTANSFGLDATDEFGNKVGPYGDKPATASTRIDSADVRIVKSHTGAPVAGAAFRWSLTVSNAGPDTAVGPFTVTDTIEAPTTFVSATGTGWSCSTIGADLTCVRTTAPGSLASGASFPVITVTVSVPADTASGTVLSNTADVTARTYDPLLPNNTDTDTATVTTAADLALAKTHSGAVVAGQDATYTLDVTNLGPSVSLAPIRVVDTLPAGSSFVSAAGVGWVCTPGSGTVTCASATDLAPGSAATQIVVTVAIPSSQTGTVVNTATVSGATPDPNLANNTATDSTPVGRSADLSIQKTSNGLVVAGTHATYHLVVDNAGPSDAAAPVRIVDTLPAGLTFVASHDVVGGGSWTCAAVAQVVTCTLGGPLAADPGELVDGDAKVDLEVAADAGATGTLLNTASVSSPTTDPNLANNTDTDVSTSVLKADLVVVKSHTGPATAGASFTWHIDVRNDGPSVSPGPIVVTDSLPAGTSFVSAVGTDWLCTESTGTVTCVRALPLADLTSAPTIDLVVTVDPSVGPSVLVNHASVDGPVTDPKPGNNTDTDLVTVIDDANVRVAKATTGANPVRAGGTTEFTLAVTNEGPSTADAVVVVDTLPVGLVPVSASGAGWTCSAPVGQVVTCARASQLPGPATTILVTATAATDVPDGTTLTNTARVSTATPGDKPGDNSASSTVGIVAEADLVIAKTHDPSYDALAAGTRIVYDVAVRNDGPSDAQPDVTVVDTLPAGLSFVSSSGPWTCTPAGQVVTCVLDGGSALVAGASAPSLAITALVAADVDAGPYRNTAVVASPTTDPKLPNNTTTNDVTVTQSADLSIVKSHSDAVKVGDPLSFTLAVTNAGPSEARAVSVTDVLPSSLTFVSATGTGWACGETAGTVTCDLATPLAPGASAEPITVTVTVLASAYPSVDNTATVGSTTPDPRPKNNTSTDTVPVPALVDLSITKTHTGTAHVGDPLTYTLTVSNAGPTADPGPQAVTDTLPPGLRFVSGTGTGWVCTAAGQAVTCVHTGALDVAASTTYDLVVDVLPNAFPSVVNTATVSTPSVETDLTNNVAVDPTEVLPDVELALVKSLGQFDSATMLATWVIAVTNNGPNVSQDPIVVTDVLPTGLTFVSAAGPGWVCGVAGRTVTCTFSGAVPVGRTVAFELVTRVSGSPGTVIDNHAFLTDHVDRVPTNDRSTATLELPPTGRHPHTGADTASLLLLALIAGMVGIVLVSAGRRRTERSA